MTDAQYLAWLQSPSAIRCVLVEATARVAGVETLRYMSSVGYTTGAADTPANTAYEAVISGGVSITEKLSIDGSAALSFGDIEITNMGMRDDWLNDVWTNRSVNVFFGDVRWPRADFMQVLSGTLSGISSRNRNTLNLGLRDKMQRLNTPLSDVRLGGSTTNKDRLRPYCFGECRNITPLLIDEATLKFMVHNGPIEMIIEVRDNGMPVAFTPDPATGTFKLNQRPFGVVTCSVQGDKFGGVYRNTVGALVQRIVTGFGKAADRFTSGDLDAANLAAFESAHTQPVGIYLPDSINVLQACAQLASSVGAQLVMSRFSLLRLLKIALPAVGTPTLVTAKNMVRGSLSVTDLPDVRAAIKVGYCRNYTVQTNLLTGIPESNKTLFSQEWLTTTSADATTATTYRLATEPEQIDTQLLTAATAAAEAGRRLALWRVQRQVYGYIGNASLMLQELGGAQTLQHRRHGLAAGVLGQIVGVTRGYLPCASKLEVLT